MSGPVAEVVRADALARLAIRAQRGCLRCHGWPAWAGELVGDDWLCRACRMALAIGRLWGWALCN